jgi:hemerythrin superfamily protein
MPTTKKSSASRSSASKKGSSRTVGSKRSSSARSKASAAGRSPAKKSTAARSKATLKASKPAASKMRSSKAKSGSTKASPKSKTSRAASPRRSKRPAPKGIISSAVDAVVGIFAANSSSAVELLKKDHDTVEALFEKVKSNEDRNNAPTFKKIKSELDVHAHIEETIFYPHLLENGDKELTKIVREGIEEHTQVKTLLAELDQMSGDSATFKAKLKVLMENVEHHVEEEEDEMFPMVEDQIPAETLQRLGSLMQGEKMKISKMTPARGAKQKASAATQR